MDAKGREWEKNRKVEAVPIPRSLSPAAFKFSGENFATKAWHRVIIYDLRYVVSDRDWCGQPGCTLRYQISDPGTG